MEDLIPGIGLGVQPRALKETLSGKDCRSVFGALADAAASRYCMMQAVRHIPQCRPEPAK